MKIVIPGGSGHIGTVLARAFHARGDEVVVLSRNPIKQPWRTEEWDGEIIGGWALEFEKADAVINLAGQSVQCRYNEANKKILTDSRLNSTRVVGQAIARELAIFVRGYTSASQTAIRPCSFYSLTFIL